MQEAEWRTLMFAKICKRVGLGVAASSLAFGIAIGTASSAAAGTPESYNLTHKNQPSTSLGYIRGSEGLQGPIGMQFGTGQTGYTTRNINGGGWFFGGKWTQFQPTFVRAGSGYCVWEELFDEVWTRNDGVYGTAYLRKVGDYNYGKNQSSRWHATAAAALVFNENDGGRGITSVFRIYAC